jgi:signal transduction histidine kinase
VALTRQLVAFSRQRAVAPQPVDVNQVVRDAAAMLRPLLGTEIDVDVHTAPDVPVVLADPGQLDQILVNLAVNARDAMPHGGRLNVAVAQANARPGEAGRLIGPGATPGRYAVIEVSDTGAGMDAETQARIFEPFFTTKELGKGTGLGLPVVEGIVRQANGAITVRSEVGRGTTVTVFWPAAPDVGASGMHDVAVGAGVDGGAPIHPPARTPGAVDAEVARPVAVEAPPSGVSPRGGPPRVNGAERQSGRG